MGMSPRLAFAIETARIAGDSTLELFRLSRKFQLKNNLTPVTDADLNAERIIREQIATQFPGEAILGEEEGGDMDANDRWTVDPIDGTKSFIAGVPLYATLISYEINQEPVLGVAYFPALNEILYAEKGLGAYYNGNKCQVCDNDAMENAIICSAGFQGLSASNRQEGFMKLANKCLVARTWCDAFGHALVASGRADAMIDPRVSRWDISAMAIIVREAGGTFSDFSGSNELSHEAISTTPHLQREILEAFR